MLLRSHIEKNVIFDSYNPAQIDEVARMAASVINLIFK